MPPPFVQLSNAWRRIDDRNLPIERPIATSALSQFMTQLHHQGRVHEATRLNALGSLPLELIAHTMAAQPLSHPPPVFQSVSRTAAPNGMGKKKKRNKKRKQHQKLNAAVAAHGVPVDYSNGEQFQVLTRKQRKLLRKQNEFSGYDSRSLLPPTFKPVWLLGDAQFQRVNSRFLRNGTVTTFLGLTIGEFSRRLRSMGTIPKAVDVICLGLGSVDVFQGLSAGLAKRYASIARVLFTDLNFTGRLVIATIPACPFAQSVIATVNAEIKTAFSKLPRAEIFDWASALVDYRNPKKPCFEDDRQVSAAGACLLVQAMVNYGLQIVSAMKIRNGPSTRVARTVMSEPDKQINVAEMDATQLLDGSGINFAGQLTKGADRSTFSFWGRTANKTLPKAQPLPYVNKQVSSHSNIASRLKSEEIKVEPEYV